VAGLKINEIKAKLAATKTPQPQAKQPVDDRFISVLELIRRIQQTPDTTAQQAADCLLSWGLLMDGAPPIIVNSNTRGLVLAEAMQQKCAIQRIEHVFHRGSFESDDGLVTSSDYELFGFDRTDFANFLASKAGEPLDLFSPLESDDFPPWPADAEREPLSRESWNLEHEITAARRVLQNDLDSPEPQNSEEYLRRLESIERLRARIGDMEAEAERLAARKESRVDSPIVEQEPPSALANWKAKAFEIALAYIDKYKAQNLFPSQNDVCWHVEEEMRKMKIYGPHGRPLSAAYIKRNAISSGGWWAKNRPK